ncbi:MAG TPA: L-aspartate oxidase [Thermoanaerobaculia bacterium]|nr:L-aspartate oxidase [Thermoanaerobaculia bacterium]
MRGLSKQAAEVVIVGSGVAGLAAALSAARGGRRVAIVTKTALASGSSPLAQGGLAAAVAADDAPSLHAADTERVGRELCDHDVVRLLTESAPAEVARLLEAGARLDRDESGELALGREGGHGRARIVHAGGDRTGAELVRALIEAARREPRIEVREGAFAAELLVGGDGAVGGVLVLEEDDARPLHAGAVVLATGGAGQLYRRTTNPAEATGDGIAMAARAGALLSDLEMVQFHPTALALAPKGSPLALLTEALRGAGATLVDRQGRRFLIGVHPDAELAPRDVVARELWRRATRGESSFLDLRELARAPGVLRARFPAAALACAGAGLDPAIELVPVTPAAHYLVGGVWTDSWGRTSLPGLYACGEVAATGAHGANRLASNSLLEALVFGRRVAEGLALPAQEWAARVGNSGPVRVDDAAADPQRDDGSLGESRERLREPRERPRESRERQREPRERLQDAMWRGAGVARTGEGLRELLDELDAIESLGVVAGATRSRAGRGACELRNLIELGRLVAAAALLRRESRGCHHRADHPEARPELALRSKYSAAELLAEARRQADSARQRAVAVG